jgi:uncharacterized membrane protein YqjE
MVASLSRLVPALLRHLDAYSDIAEEDAKDAASSLGACLLAATIAAGLALLAALMLCVWILTLTWDEPWRAWVPAGLAAVFAVGAIISARPLRRLRAGKPTFFVRVRSELHKDRILVDRALHPMEDTPPG